MILIKFFLEKKMKYLKINLEKLLTYLLIAFLILSVFFQMAVTKKNVSYADTISEIQEDATEVISYKDIFNNYYEYACKQLDLLDDDYVLTFNDFINGYYYNGFNNNEEVSISDYVYMVIDYVSENAHYDYDSEIMATSSSSIERRCLLKSFKDSLVTPANEFEYAPVYNGVNGEVNNLMDCVKVGDIIHETKAVAGFGHTAVVVNLNHKSEYGNYIQTIEAVKPSVYFGFLDDTRMVDYETVILRVEDITNPIREKVSYFLHRQIGKKYDLNILRTNTSIDSSEWYCSELAYAAYNYAGLNLINRSDGYKSNGVLPNDILSSLYTYNKILGVKSFLDVQLIGMGVANWTIRVYNNTGSTKIVYYNTKFCFENDASGWTNLKDVATITISDGHYADVKISSNWFATNIAICCIDSYMGLFDARFITYASNLKKEYGHYSMNVKTSILRNS